MTDGDPAALGPHHDAGCGRLAGGQARGVSRALAGGAAAGLLSVAPAPSLLPNRGRSVCWPSSALPGGPLSQARQGKESDLTAPATPTPPRRRAAAAVAAGHRDCSLSGPGPQVEALPGSSVLNDSRIGEGQQAGCFPNMPADWGLQAPPGGVLCRFTSSTDEHY